MPILFVNQSKSKININEKVSIDALSVVQDSVGTAPESISFFIGNEKNPSIVCNDKHYCGMTYFVVDKNKGNKWVKFTIKSQYKTNTVSKFLYVFVTNKVVGGQPVPAPNPEQPTTPAGDQSPTYSQIITTNHQPKVGESFTATIYPSEKGAINLNKIDVIFDGKVVKTCALNNSIASCGHTFGPFVAGDVGEHKYEFLMVGVNGKTSQPWGKFWVNAAPQAVEDYPEYDKVVTSGDTVKVGEYFKATVYAKTGKTMHKVEGYIDGVLVPSGNNNSNGCPEIGGCGLFQMKSKVMGANDVGEHTYKFIVGSKSGKSLVINGKFQVIAVEEIKDLLAPEVSVSSDKDVLKLGESATLTANASDNKAVSKIQMLVFGGVVKECLGVNTCSYQIGLITDKTYVTKYTYSAFAYDAAGNNMFTGNKYVTVNLSQPAPAVEPAVSVEASKAKINTADVVNFKGSVNLGSKKLTKLQLLVNKALAKECITNVCEYVGGPYPTYVGSVVNYAATAYFSDGSYKTTGYYFIPVTDVPTVSIISTPQNPLDTSAIMFTANATVGNKAINYLEIMVNGKVAKTCPQATSCGYMGGPYKEYSRNNITYLANLFFTDGSSITTGEKTQFIYSSNTAQ